MTEQITASDLLAKQREVAEMVEEQTRAWWAIDKAKSAVTRAEDEYSTARWLVEEGKRELSEMEAAVTACESSGSDA